jgi:hypothetical protein
LAGHRAANRRQQMNPSWILIVIGVLAATLTVGCVVWSRRQSSLVCLDELRPWRDLEPGERVKRLEQWLSGEARSGPERAAGLVMLGCAWLDRGRPALAARPFQVAYHAEPDYVSALVLAFACVKPGGDTSEGMLRKLLETWHEVRRPSMGTSRWERALLAGFRGSNGLGEGSRLAAAIGSLPSDVLTGQLREALAARPEWAWPLYRSQPTSCGIVAARQ